MRNSKPITPDWILSDDWAVSVSPECFILYPRAWNKETGERGGWSGQRATYHASISQLLRSLLKKETRKRHADDLAESIKTGVKAYESAEKALLAELAAALPFDGSALRASLSRD